jgi:hypothetical protein
MAEAPDTLSFRVSAETLNGALQSPPQKIRLAREACEALPHVVRHLLRRGSVMHDDLQA